MKWLSVILVLVLAVSAWADGGRFINDVWVTDSALTSGDFQFAGNVGIGTTSINAKLVIEGDGDPNYYNTVQARKFNGTPSFTIRDDGNVGIGSTLPQRLLDVGGAIAVNQTGATSEILKISCIEGALNSCACYSTTSATKSGSIKINVNGLDRWIDFKDSPN